MTFQPNTPDASRAPAAFAVYPLRYSGDAPAMITFLRTLGMAPAVTAGADSFGQLVAGAGHVMVHGVTGSATGPRSGDTDLCLAVESTDGAATVLRTAGLSVDVWDETYGRQGVVDGPAGESVALNEQQRDLYGYQGHDARDADSRLSVTAVLASEDFDRDAAWAARFDFLSDAPGDEWFRALHGPGAAGMIGLHRPVAGDRRVRPTGSEFGEVLQVRLGFTTTEDLEELAARLRGAGYSAEVVDDEVVRSVHVEDPDGQHLEIHSRAQA